VNRREFVIPAALKQCAAILLLGAAVFVAYAPALRGGFLFDDDSLLSQSRPVQAANGLYLMWFTTQPLDYWPVTNSSFWLEWRLWGLQPLGYHVTNVLLHVASAVLIWAILRRLHAPGAWLAASIFALHPVNVQSVAWIAQRKNTLSMVFFLLSILSFIHDLDTGKRRWYVLSVVAFVLAMLSKGSVAILPGVLLLVIWWRNGTIARRDLVRMTPFVVVAVGLTLVNIWFQARMPGGIRNVTPIERVLGAADVVWFYLMKALAPIGLLFMYPQHMVDAGNAMSWFGLAAAAGVTIALWRARSSRIGRVALFLWLLFCCALLPVMGFTDVYFMTYSLVADHYQYVALAAIAIGVGSAIASLIVSPPIRNAIATVILLTLGILTWRQSHLYASAETLYRTTVEKNPSAWVMQNNLGAVLIDRGAYEEAATHLREALRLRPDYPSAHTNLCQAAAHLSRFDEALSECELALRKDPTRWASHNSFGLALASKGRVADAAGEFDAALRLNPSYAEAHYNLADVLLAIGRPADAARHYQTVLQLWPEAAGAYSGLGRALQELGQSAEAETALRNSIRLRPDLSDARKNLADLLLETGRADEAAAQYRDVLVRDPRSADAHNNLAVALVRMGQTDEALREAGAAVALEPNNAEFRANLSKIAARSHVLPPIGR
jgi:tetratricopeptide (TPR) repeat protein